ncbi:MAG: hypothetical protein N3B13_07720 [Deltaproteobacteria bacterium]|nr:hypothetical protein [Deltaproteobacteria bacterium]
MPSSGKVFLRLVLMVFIYNCNGNLPDINYQNPCFEKDIVPLLKRDCASCHENGEYKFRITGSVNDYNTVVAYCNVDEPGKSLFLEYATGHKKHPRIWKEGTREYWAFYNWVANGAKEKCLDESIGECRGDEDCSEIACVCPDLEVVNVSRCYIDRDGKGTCAKDNNCTEPDFGICKFIDKDAGFSDITNDVSGRDIMADYGDETVSDLSDISYADYVTDTTGETDVTDTGYDSGYDIGVNDSGYDTGYDTGDTNVSFASQIVPMIKTDCRSCHYAGQYGVKLTGTTADYPEVMRYVDINNPEDVSGFLWWAAGGNNHPIKWPKGGTKYNLFLKWVNEGANNN